MTSEYIFKDRDSGSVQQATLCFLINSKRVLLAMKKRGFAVGLWNGVGGKVKVGDETIEVAARREAGEEIGVRLQKVDKVALLHFYFPDDPVKLSWNQDVHVFLCTRWEGTPKETEEMRPRWFRRIKLPFKKMWSDDSIWVPMVLASLKIEAWFAMDEYNGIKAYKIVNLK